MDHEGIYMAKAKQEKLENSKQKLAEKAPKAKKATKSSGPIDEKLVSNSELLVAAEPKAQTAKAGKRSEKGIKESEEKIDKIERQKASVSQASDEKVPTARQQPVKATRTRLERRAKGYRKSAELIDSTKSYNLAAALELASKTSHVKFDAGVELHVRLGVDPRQADQNLRDTVLLPAGTGKTVRIAVFADADQATAAKNAGADIAAGEEFLQQLDKGVIDFDILIATPATMSKLGKYARLLGPKGLMPNPKSGTVTADVAKAVTESKAGRVEYRVDSTGIVHVGIGKVSFGADKLQQNAKAIMNSIKANKPSGLKGNYFRSIFVTTSMGPSIHVSETDQ